MSVMAAMAIANLGMTVGGKVMSGIQNYKNQKMWKDRGNDLDNWFKNEYNKDFLNTSVAKSSLTKLKDTLKDSSKKDDQVGTMMGASEEAKANQRKGNLDVVGDSINKLASYGTRYKDSQRSQYLRNRHRIDRAISDGRSKSAKSWSDTADNAGDNLTSTITSPGFEESLSSLFGS